MKINRRQLLGSAPLAAASLAAAPKVDDFESIRKEFPRAMEQDKRAGGSRGQVLIHDTDFVFSNS